MQKKNYRKYCANIGNMMKKSDKYDVIRSFNPDCLEQQRAEKREREISVISQRYMTEPGGQNAL